MVYLRNWNLWKFGLEVGGQMFKYIPLLVDLETPINT